MTSQNSIFNRLRNPRFFIKVVGIIVLVFTVIMLTSSVIKYGITGLFSAEARNEFFIPLLGVIGIILFVVIVFGLPVFMAGKALHSWYYLIIAGLIGLGGSIYELATGVSFGDETKGLPSWLDIGIPISVLISLTFIYLVFKQLFGKTKVIEGLVYERDEREKQLTSRAARNAFLTFFIITVIIGITLSNLLKDYYFTGYQVGDLIIIIQSIIIIVFAGSLIKYKVK
jgi:hypothetical protein